MVLKGHQCGSSRGSGHSPSRLVKDESGPSSASCPCRPSSQTSSLSRGPRHCVCKPSWRPVNRCKGTLYGCPRPYRYGLAFPTWLVWLWVTCPGSHKGSPQLGEVLFLDLA